MKAATRLRHALGGTYSATVLADGPIGYWRLGSNADGLGGSNTLTLQGTGASFGNASILPHGDGGSLRASGPSSQGYAKSATALTSLNAATAVTIEAWVKLNSFNASNVEDITGWYDGTSYTQFRVGDGTTNNRLDYAINAGTDLAGSGALSTGTAYHVAVTWASGTTTKFYVNGTLYNGTGVITGSAPTQALPFCIGSIGNASVLNRVMDGWIQEVAVYNKVLTQTRLQAHYNAG